MTARKTAQPDPEPVDDELDDQADDQADDQDGPEDDGPGWDRLQQMIDSSVAAAVAPLSNALEKIATWQDDAPPQKSKQPRPPARKQTPPTSEPSEPVRLPTMLERLLYGKSAPHRH